MHLTEIDKSRMTGELILDEFGKDVRRIRCGKCRKEWPGEVIGTKDTYPQTDLICPEGCVWTSDDTKTFFLDLHGYALDEANELAYEKIQEAWRNGYDYIEIIHGSAQITSWMQAECWGRGSIKWALRGRLYRGRYSKYVFNRRSKKHVVDCGSMTLALRPNPEPKAPAVWTECPDGFYHRRRP